MYFLAEEMEEYWGKKTFCLITGASKGIGRSIALNFSKKVGLGSAFLLIARSLPGLESTKAEVLKERPDLTVQVASVDLSQPDFPRFRQLILTALKEANPSSSFQHALLVQNAASLGIQSGLSVLEQSDLSEIQSYFAFNLHSFILLNSAFFQAFPTSCLKTLVHMSSDGVLEPFKTWGLYCAAKAARNVFLKSIALESGVQTINWAPGCVDTDQYEEALRDTKDPELAAFFRKYKEEGKVLSADQTVKKLMRVLASQKYVKGEHVGYGDVPDEET